MSEVQIAEDTADQQQVIGRPFQPGQSGNPAGRPRGSRNRLADRMFSDFLADWEEGGQEFFRRLRLEEPVAYAAFASRVLGSLTPRQVDVAISDAPMVMRMPSVIQSSEEWAAAVEQEVAGTVVDARVIELRVVKEPDASPSLPIQDKAE